MTTLRSALSQFVNHPRLPWRLALLVAVLSLPALTVGYQADDWSHQALIRQAAPWAQQRDPISDLFTFFDGIPEHTAEMRDRGVTPWWTPLDLKMSFWRPFTALTHIADHHLAPGVAWVAHVHSIIWMVLLALLAGFFYRKVHGPGTVAGLAALLYAVDEAHAVPAAWLANRNALIAGALGLAVLLLHMRWRQDRSAPSAILAPAVFAVALLSGESALATSAWLFAFALFLDAGSLRTRLATLLPYAAIAVGWRALYTHLGYGTQGSGLYIDPLTEPANFLIAAATRVPVLWADQFLSLPSVIVTFVPRFVTISIAVLSVAFLIPLGVVLARTLRGSRTAAFYVVGMALSTVQVAATFPSARLLTFAGLGGAGLVAELLARALPRDRAAGEPPRDPSPWAQRWAGALAFLHLLVAPPAFALTAWAIGPLLSLTFSPCDSAFTTAPEVTQKDVIFVNSGELCVSHVSIVRAVKGLPRPRTTHMLASRLYAMEVTGIDDHTIELHIPVGMQSGAADSLLRQRNDPIEVGTRIPVIGMTAEVVSWNERGLVDRVRFSFERSLWDPDMIWFCTGKRAITTFVPPRPGEVVSLLSASDR